MTTFAELQAEYTAASEGWDAAESRLRAATSALMGAQCGTMFKSLPTPRGFTHLYCTLERGHGGDHSNATSRAEVGHDGARDAAEEGSRA